MALQGTGSITATQIAVELGYTQGASTRIGDYRLNGGQDFTQGEILTIGDFENNELDCVPPSTCIRRKIGLYQNIGIGTNSDATTTGEGSGMVFEVVIGDDSSLTGNPFDDFGTLVRVNIINGGVGNKVGDIIQINDRWIGDTGQVPMKFKVESISTVKLPISEAIPTSVGIGDSAIKFSDFYNARRTLVVDYYSQDENKPVNAKDRFDSAPKTVVGGFVGNDENTSGKKVVIVVNKNIGSDKTANDSCALRTGSEWSADTALEVLVGSEGQIIGAGGDGGRAGGPGKPRKGEKGGDGSSGLGVQYEGTGGTKVTIQSGGRIAGGGGGGGGGGGAINRQERWWGGSAGPYYGRGGFGGGGAGLPAGFALGYDTEAETFTGYNLVIPETVATLEKGGSRGINIPIGEGKFVEPRGGEIDQGPTNAYARGSAGGNGGDLGKPAETDAAKRVGFGITGSAGGGESENAGIGTGGQAGLAGAAIRRNTGMTLVIENLGPPDQLVGSTSATGIT